MSSRYCERVLIFSCKINFLNTFNTLTKDQKNENALRTKETDSLNSRFNVSLSDMYCNSPGATFQLVNRQNSTIYLKVKLYYFHQESERPVNFCIVHKTFKR